MSDSSHSLSHPSGATVGKAEALDFWCPSYQVASNKDVHTLYVAMPGVAKSGVCVELEGDQLTITGHRTQPVPETWTPIACEMGDRAYRLAVRLNVEVEDTKINAKVEDGMLTLTLPVKEATKPRQISIS